MSYPTKSIIAVEQTDRRWQDEQAAALYDESGAKALPTIHGKLVRALDKQAENMEKYADGKYSRERTELLNSTTRAIAEVQSQMELWHVLIYPNQRLETIW